MRLRVIDIETSGGSPSEIIEIAAVDVVRMGDRWIAEPPRSRLFRPMGGISVHAMAIHHLTDEDFGDDMEACSDGLLQAFLEESGRPDFLVAHNAAFEARHITATATGDLRWLCTVRAARQAWVDAPGHSNQVLRYWRCLRLDPAFAMPPHRAAPDAWVTAHILIDLLRAHPIKTLIEWSDVSRGLERMPFGKHRGKAWADVPADYLTWIVGQSEMSADVLTGAQAEMTRRDPATSTILLTPLD